MNKQLNKAPIFSSLCNFKDGTIDHFTPGQLLSADTIACHYIPRTYAADALYRLSLAKGLLPIEALKVVLSNSTHNVVV